MGDGLDGLGGKRKILTMTWASLTQAPGERKEWLRRSAHKGQNASGEEIKNLILDMLRVLSLCDSQVSIRVVDTILQLTNGVSVGDTDVCPMFETMGVEKIT